MSAADTILDTFANARLREVLDEPTIHTLLLERFNMAQAAIVVGMMDFALTRGLQHGPACHALLAHATDTLQ